MCSICHMSPCPAGCPNAPDPPGVTTCVRCGEAVRVGEEYARKVDALMRSMERLCLDFEVPPEEQERLDTAAYTFYAIWDEIRMVSDDLERLAGDARVVDAIYAANDVRKRNGTLKTEE